MNICLFTQEEINKPLSLNDERGKHIVKVLHKKAGDSFVSGIIEGASGISYIKEINDNSIIFDFKPTGDGKPLFPLKMIIGFPRPIQLKRLLRDVAALGVSEIHLTHTELGEKSYLKSNIIADGGAYKMLLDGTVQAGGTKVPKIFVHESLRECLKAVESTCQSEKSTFQAGGQSETGPCGHQLKLCLDNISPVGSLSQNVRKGLSNCSKEGVEPEIIAAIGGERGWTNKERELFAEKGYILSGMGNRIMRTETAATVAGAIILNELGVLN